MRRFLILNLLVLVAFASCRKMQDVGQDREIIIGIDGDYIDMFNDTKATAVTSLPSTLYWGGTTGGNAAGSSNETSKWACESKSVSSSTIATGRYQTATATTYNYYVSNASFTVGASTSMTVANNSTDIICGRTAQTTSATPSVTLNHIFARTGSLTLSVPSGYSQSSVSWSIKSKGSVSGTAGTYNLRSQSWTAASTTLSSTAITNSSDLYLIPGTYTITCSFTLSKGDFSKAYTQSCDVTLFGGKINNITATTTTNEAVQVSFGVSVAVWTNIGVSTHPSI